MRWRTDVRHLCGALLLTPFLLLRTAYAIEDDARSCESAGRAAEVQYNLPAGLLTAIGRVESGRGPLRQAWPWTVAAGRTGSFFESREAASAQIEKLQAEGVQLIDVGCFQVNLFWHGGAFMDVKDALDPTTNARTAARFLADLYRQTSDWGTAVARYHNADPFLGFPYRDRVLGIGLGVGGAPITTRRALPVDPFVVSFSRRLPVSTRLLPRIIRAGFH